MDKNDSFLLKHFIDISRNAKFKNYPSYSGFLNLNEQTILLNNSIEYFCSYSLYGGYEYAERQMVCFDPDALFFKDNYPVVVLKINYLNPKYAEKLGHRDILGALMNLGIERSLIGDIITSDNEFFVFVQADMADFIKENLTRIRHTSVFLSQIENKNFTYKPVVEKKSSTIASNRLDTFVAAICNLSRQKSSEYILSDHVFINGKLVNDINAKIKENDLISLRGYGKIRFINESGISKKGKIIINYEIFK